MRKYVMRDAKGYDIKAFLGRGEGARGPVFEAKECRAGLEAAEGYWVEVFQTRKRHDGEDSSFITASSVAIKLQIQEGEDPSSIALEYLRHPWSDYSAYDSFNICAWLLKVEKGVCKVIDCFEDKSEYNTGKWA